MNKGLCVASVLVIAATLQYGCDGMGRQDGLEHINVDGKRLYYGIVKATSEATNGKATGVIIKPIGLMKPENATGTIRILNPSISRSSSLLWIVPSSPKLGLFRDDQVLEPHKYFPEFLMHVAELYGVDPGGFTLVGLGHNGTMATRLALSAPQMIESMILVPELTPDYVAIQEAATHLRTPVVIFVSVEDRELVRSQQAEQLVNSGKIEVRFVRVESTMRNGLIQSIPSVIDYIESSASTGARSDDSDGPVS